MIKPVDLHTIWRIRHEVMYPELPIHHIKLNDDPAGTHLAVFVDNEPVSVISLFERDGVWQFRKFATLQTHQGKGYGTLLLEHTMTLAKARSATSIWCNARTTACALYERFGMHPTGDTWDANGYTYIKMEKNSKQAPSSQPTAQRHLPEILRRPKLLPTILRNDPPLHTDNFRRRQRRSARPATDIQHPHSQLQFQQLHGPPPAPLPKTQHRIIKKIRGKIIRPFRLFLWGQ